MRVLVNYGKDDKPRLDQLAYVLQNHGISAFSTAYDLTLGELLKKAHDANCQGILLCNEATLAQCVNESDPTVDNWRGSRLNFSIPTFVINKLAHIDTVPYGRWLLDKDLSKLKLARKISSVFSFEKLLNIKDFPEAYNDLSKAEALAYDIETKTFPAKELEVGQTVITCASWTGIFADGSLRTYMLPLVSFNKTYWENDALYAKAIYFLRKVNALKNIKAMHNGMYDATHSIVYHAEPVNYVYDTMAMAHAEYAELPKDLAFVASYQLYDYINWKGDAASASKTKDIEKYWAYNAKDTWHTARIMIEQLRTAPEYALRNYKEKFKITYPSLYCNFEGLLIDQGKRTLMRDKSETELNAARMRLRTKVADSNFNPGSWQQVEKYVYKVFGAKRPMIGKSKSCTDEKNLLSVATQHPLLARLATDIITYRENQKAIGTYYDFLQFRGRLLWALNPFGTETERFACSASSLWCGTQVQNIPSYAKGMLIADPGFEIFEADNKQSEGRTTAYCAQEEALIAALEDAEKDFYKVLGTLFFDIPYEEVSDFFRNKVLKKIVHGTNYMMGAKTFIENAGIMILYEAAAKLGLKIVSIVAKNSTDEITLKNFATTLLEAYHKPFPRIRMWYKEIEFEIAKTGFLVSPLGHTRRFFGNIRRDHNMLRGGVAHQPQNLSGTILNMGVNRVYKELILPGHGNIRMKAQIHDSIFGQWKIELRDYYAPRVLECMRNPVIIHGRSLLIPVDIKYGHNWEEYSKENPDGTRKWSAPKDPSCTEPNRKDCPRLCQDFCNKEEERKGA